MKNIKAQYQSSIHKYQDEQVRKGFLLFNLLLPIILVYITESFASHSPLGGLQFLIHHPYAFLVNVFIVLSTFMLASLFTKRIGFLILIAFIWFALGVVNGVVLIFRVTPFSRSDLLLLKDGKDIISKYLGPLQIIAILITVVLVILFVIYFIFITPSGSHHTSFKYSLPSIVISFVLAIGLTLLGQQTGLLEKQFHELSVSYQNNGFYYCFVLSVLDVGIHKPSDYSEEVILNITNFDELTEQVETHSRKANVVIVQLESFFNVNRLKNVRFSSNPLPNLSKILPYYPSGLLNVPVVGAGTVNSEFEVLTGMNIDDFGVGEYPFKTIVKEKPCESIAYNLKENGYHTFAIHNNTGDFYERNQVYCNLGFDTFIPVEYMCPKEYTPLDWCKDNILVNQIQAALDSTPDQDLVYAVSVQGHGSYPTEDLDYEKHITITESNIDDPEYLNSLTYYVNQIYEMDQFIVNLIDMLNNQKEPTILLMYGDHLPSLDFTDDDFLWGNLYQTEYFFWSNCTDPLGGGNREAYTLNSEILHALEITSGAINSYHQNSYAKLLSEQITEEEYLSGLHDLEYDVLYGDNLYYNGEYPYETVDMKMGLYPVTIEDVELTKDHVLILRGQNFTRYSRIHINDSEVTTLFLDPTTLVAADITLEDRDKLTVCQSTLSESDPFTYRISK